MREKTNRNKWLHVRLSPVEYDQISKACAKTTCRKLSDFTRRKLLEKPLTVTYRNQSADAAIEQLAGLKTELHAAGNNFNQAVKKLHVLTKIKEFEHWLIAYEIDKRRLLAHIEMISDQISKISEQW